MEDFDYRESELYCEGVRVSEIAESVGTPLYVYSHAALERAYRELEAAFSGMDHLVCFAVKANPNLAVLRTLASLGAGADIVSGGELYRTVRAGFDPKKVVFSGVGKTDNEFAAGLGERILLFNVESASELKRLEHCARSYGKRARVTLRINPDVAAGGHPHVSTGGGESKFGIPIDEALELAESIKDNSCIELLGVHQHVGSQITTTDPFVSSVNRTAELAEKLTSRGFDISYFNLGGGLGIRYADEHPLTPAELVGELRTSLEATGAKILCEMGRYIAGNAGSLVTRVLYRKDSGQKRFLVADAGMNDLLRPSLYEAHHEVLPVRENGAKVRADLVGPVCESGDYLARDRELPDVGEDELAAVMSAGAYGSSMSSNYNSRPRPAEVMVAGDRWAIVREREHHPDLIRGEIVPAFL